MKKPTFEECIKFIEKDYSFPLYEFIDDCNRIKKRGEYEKRYAELVDVLPALNWHKDKHIISLFRDHFDEFEAWLKLQL